MKKMMILCLLVIGLFLVGCAEEMSDEEFSAEMEGLSDEDLNLVLSDDVGEDAALAGNARALPTNYNSLKKKIAKNVYTCSIENDQIVWDLGTYQKKIPVHLCVGSNLVEYYCNGNYPRVRSPSTSCENGCVNGACIEFVDIDFSDFKPGNYATYVNNYEITKLQAYSTLPKGEYWLVAKNPETCCQAKLMVLERSEADSTKLEEVAFATYHNGQTISSAEPLAVSIPGYIEIEIAKKGTGTIGIVGLNNFFNLGLSFVIE